MTELKLPVPLPAPYQWLLRIDSLPAMVREGLLLHGVRETEGAAHNPVIMGWAREVDLAAEYTADEIPWCGLYMAVVAQRARWPVPRAPLWARNWAKFGQASPDPGLGDVLVFSRPGGGGHVGIYIGQDRESFSVLGGNQGDSVSIVRIAKARLLAARRPMWRYGQPKSVKPYFLNAAGNLSTNEA